MASCLLGFIRAGREGIWDLDLKAVATMIPYFYIANRTIYARWSCVYLADMRRLPSTALTAHDEFLRGNHPIMRSK